MLLLFLGTLGGVLMGIVVAMVRDSADHTFRRRDQIEGATGLPVIAMVPALLGRTSPTAHVLRNPMSPFSEALRKIFVGLELSDPENPPKTVMFSSAMPAEGKSVLAASLGRLLASNGKRVLLIDCDWRCPSLHRPFRLANKGGLAALLTDGQANLDEIVVNDALSGVDVIVAGHWEPQNIHMLTSERMRLALKTFAKNYDLVILDSPPVLVGAEVLSLDATPYQGRLSATGARDLPVPLSGGGSRMIDVVPWDLAQLPYVEQSAAFASIVASAFRKRNVLLHAPDAVRLPLRPLVGANMPAVLVEMGYVTNADDEAALGGAERSNRLIDALVDAIEEVRRGIPSSPAEARP